ncbi:MAG: bifunctional proline dehydrogenase/L-glutamate gamma-semialdehyde dehydrogenase PutA, partial [Parvibaculaceae bacterium]|nr:bifunctional proline dehydrogenase/L-glutamate gamma-semialdehyde dehydrogenase PutA [Parvibaculaceae bacterium]
PKFTDALLVEYGLSTEEGVALMRLAESILRVPDAATMDLLIEDKIAPANWSQHLSSSVPTFINASTCALGLTQRVLADDTAMGTPNLLRSTLKRLGVPVIRMAVKAAVRIIGRQFVHGRTIKEALAASSTEIANGYTHSYDMLGEAAVTAQDAYAYFQAYSDAIGEIAKSGDPEAPLHSRPGISVKLSALDPSYDQLKQTMTVPHVSNRLLSLCRQAKAAQIGLNVDAEEMHRLDLSLDVLDTLIGHPDLVGWDGLGVVVQAYSKRASFVIDWLYARTHESDCRLMVRLVKGAYWDTEIKQAQLDGISDFPVYTKKAHTDVSYICCAHKLLHMRDHLYPQFATHNAHSVASVLALAPLDGSYEFQRLHGMGEALHDQIERLPFARCRIYAPVGPHQDLLAYLVRRLLENGANSSFVNQLADDAVSSAQMVADPFVEIEKAHDTCPSAITFPPDLFAPARKNSKGWDLRNTRDRQHLTKSRDQYREHVWHAAPSCLTTDGAHSTLQIYNPSNPADLVGSVSLTSPAGVENSFRRACLWEAPVRHRAKTLRACADLFEASTGELTSCLTREAGKTLGDALSEIREAVDFLRYYAGEGERQNLDVPLGIIACISPWNFPLAIFTGQIAGALACGNAVLAKPSEQTPLIAQIAVDLFHRAGVPETALQLLPGDGISVGGLLTSDPRVQGVCFTGSTQTAQLISRSMAKSLAPCAPLIAETGGINAAIIDSTCLLEHAVRDVVVSAFQSAGQRCSALRMLYVQEEIYAPFVKMLSGTMDELIIGDPQNIETDVGPLIDTGSARAIDHYIEKARASGQLLKQVPCPSTGNFVGPALLSVSNIEALSSEVFGPVLHIAPFNASLFDQVLDDINAAGYGLTFGIHSRIESRTRDVARRVKVGNVYVNRNQIGAVVGSQPFGGEGLSGTGPKAGGPHYLPRLCAHNQPADSTPFPSVKLGFNTLQKAINQTSPPSSDELTQMEMPSPTGESNVLTTRPRGLILCLGPSFASAKIQSKIAQKRGCSTLIIANGARERNALDGSIDPVDLTELSHFSGVSYWGDTQHQKAIRQALAERNGPILPLFTEYDFGSRCVLEKLTCIDTTAAGGNTSLLAGSPPQPETEVEF